MSYRPYTGVGSRKTPPEVCVKFTAFAKKLAYHGFTLRSGAAKGADEAFEDGCDERRGLKEIYIPWSAFGDPNRWNRGSAKTVGDLGAAIEIAKEIHPAWHNLCLFGKKAHARNVCQVLGEDLKTPSLFVICWTEDGKQTGGTNTAITLAHQRGIPVFNLGAVNRTLTEILVELKRRRAAKET